VRRGKKKCTKTITKWQATKFVQKHRQSYRPESARVIVSQCSASVCRNTYYTLTDVRPHRVGCQTLYGSEVNWKKNEIVGIRAGTCSVPRRQCRHSVTRQFHPADLTVYRQFNGEPQERKREWIPRLKNREASSHDRPEGMC